MKVLAIGRAEYLLRALEVISKEHEIVAIVTGPSNSESLAKEEDFVAFSQLVGARYYFSSVVDQELLDFCFSVGADVAVSVNWMSVIGQDFISLFRFGVLNAHCGDIPDYRGNAILNWAVLRGEKEVFVSIHTMLPGELDVGAVYARGVIPLSVNDDIADLMGRFTIMLPRLFSEALANVESGRCLMTVAEVKAKQGFRCFPRVPADGCIDWYATAYEIDRLVKASASPYPGAFTCFYQNGRLHKFYVLKSRVVCDSTFDVGVPGHIIMNDKISGETHVYTGKGIVAMKLVRMVDGDAIRPAEFFRSIRMRLGLSDAVLIDMFSGVKSFSE